MKVVELKKLNNFHVGSFSSCLEKSKVILEILICPNSKKFEFLWIGIWIANCFDKFTMFHSKLALVTKTCFVAYKILNNFHFGGILSSVQILGQICKTTKLGSSGYGLLQCSSRGGALPPGQSRGVQRRHVPGHAAACCCASLGRPHPQRVLRRVDKAPGGRGPPFLFSKPHRRRPCCTPEFPSLAFLPSHSSTPIASPSS